MIQKFLSFAIPLLFILHFCWAKGKDKEVEGDEVVVKVLGQSGKISVWKKNDSRDNAVHFEMDQLSELDANGTEVGQGGQSKHSFNSFATQEFVFTDLRNKTYQNISAEGFDFKSTINDGNLTVSVTIFKGNGTIVNGNEEFDVKKGTVKTDIVMENWNFCNPCQIGKGPKEYGEALEFTMTIKYKNSNPRKREARKPSKSKRKRAPSYDLGGNATLILSQVYLADGMWKNMSEGYPKMITKGSKQSFVFRFEKFNKTLKYDPATSFTDGGSDSVNVSVSTSSPATSVTDGGSVSLPTVMTTTSSVEPTKGSFAFVLFVSFFGFIGMTS